MVDPKEGAEEKFRLQEVAAALLADIVGSGPVGLGVDIQLISEINHENPNFVERNFTSAEIAYCRAAPDIAASFAGRWAAKEAVVKAKMNLLPEGGNWTKGSSAPLIDIEILPGNSGAPTVVQYGYSLEVSDKLGISQIKVSISHCGDYVLAAAVALSDRKPNK